MQVIAENLRRIFMKEIQRVPYRAAQGIEAVYFFARQSAKKIQAESPAPFRREPKRMRPVLVVLVLLFALLFAACAKEGGAVKTLRVGTGNDYPPYCYLDPNGELAGFEKDVLDAIDRKLPEYRFSYEVLEFKNILSSLEAGRIDIAAHQFTENEERRQKFLFSNEGYIGSYSYIVVKGDAAGIHSLDDLQGKRVSVPPASDWALAVERYNAGHAGNPVLIDYYEATPDVLITNLATGVIDATIATEADVKLINTFWNAGLKTTGEPIGKLEESRFVFHKNAAALRDAIDGALAELEASGELETLKQKAVDNFFKNAGR